MHELAIALLRFSKFRILVREIEIEMPADRVESPPSVSRSIQFQARRQCLQARRIASTVIFEILFRLIQDRKHKGFPELEVRGAFEQLGSKIRQAEGLPGLIAFLQRKNR